MYIYIYILCIYIYIGKEAQNGLFEKLSGTTIHIFILYCS